MCAKQDRREVLIGAASVAASAALSVPVGSGLLAQQLPLASDADYLGIFVSGCGAACDCDWYMRVDCAFNRIVRKLGDKYVVYDSDNKVIGEADPGFKPLDEDLAWVAKVEYARAVASWPSPKVP